jgi:hypothetical protein
MIRFNKTFLEPYYKESFYKDLKYKTFVSAFGHLFAASLFAAFIAALGFYFTMKDQVEVYTLAVVDTISNEYPDGFKMSINRSGFLESNVAPISLFKTNTAGGNNGRNFHKLIAIDSNTFIKDVTDFRKYDSHYVLLRDGYVMAVSGRTESYAGFEGFQMTRSLLDIKLEQVRGLIPFIPRFITVIIFFAIFVVYPIHYLVISFFIAAALFIIFKYWFKEKLLYKDAYIASVFAGGTVLFVQILFIAIGLPLFPFFTLITGTLFVVLMHRNAEYFPITRKKVKHHLKHHLKKLTRK